MVRFISFFLLFAFLLSACAPASTSAPTPLVASFSTPTLMPSNSLPTSTATPQPPTATPLPPTPTATPAGLRRPAENGMDTAARRLSAAPTLDGNLDEWSGFPCYTLDQKEHLVYGDPATWGGAKDLSAAFCWGWDSDALYLALRVMDDKITSFPKSKGNFWETGDFLALFFDVDIVGDFEQAQPNEDDFHLVFSPIPSPDASPFDLLFPKLATEAKKARSKEIEYKFLTGEGKYEGEIKIPWSFFGQALDLQWGYMGSALAVYDNDADQPGKEHAISTAKKIAQGGFPTLWDNFDLLKATLEIPTSAPRSASTSSNYLSVLFKHFLPDEHLMLYIDCRAEYGEDSVPGIRADYLVQDRGLHYWSGEKGNKGWKWLGLVPFSNRNGEARWDVHHKWLSMCDPAQSWNVVIQRLDKRWNQYYVSPVLTPSAGNLFLRHDEAPLMSITFIHHAPADHLFVYIDSDNNENTGHKTIFPGRGIDYILQDDSLYRYTGLPMPNTWEWVSLARTEKTPTRSTWVFSSGYIGFPNISARTPIKMGFSRQDASWSNQFTSPILWIPDYTVVYNEPALFDITYNHAIPDDHVFVYIDSDHNASTGASGYPLTGVDYVLQDGSLYRWNGSSMDWVASVRTVDTSTQDRWVFSSSFIHNLSFPIHLVFSRQNSTWSALYTSGTISSTAYTITHSEPPPTPTPTPTPTPIPAPTYSFTFNNNFSSGDHLYVFLDTDNNSGTGYTVGSIGADYMLQDGSLWQSTGGPGWGWNPVTCGSLSFVLGTNASWTFQAACIGSPSFSYPAVFRRENSGWVAQYTSTSVLVSSYSVSHTEPPPTPTPTPVPTYSFTFNNNFSSGDNLVLYLDVDGNSATGYSYNGIGVDYMFQNAALYQHAGSGWSWNPLGLCGSFTSGGNASWIVPATCIGSPSPANGWPVIFERANSSWVPQYTCSTNVSGYSASCIE